MMAQPDKTCGQEDGEERQLLSESIQSKTDVATQATKPEKSHGRKEETTVSSRFLSSHAALVTNGYETRRVSKPVGEQSCTRV